MWILLSVIAVSVFRLATKRTVDETINLPVNSSEKVKDYELRLHFPSVRAGGKGQFRPTDNLLNFPNKSGEISINDCKLFCNGGC